MHSRRIRILAIFAVTSAIAVGSACDDGAIAQPCSDIPAGGCPISRGVACDDPACVAVYACRADNRWELTKTCPPREAGAIEPDAGGDAGGPSDASIDAPPGAFGGPGCPELQFPDCSLGLAMSCAPACCGCEDLFVCASGGWELWGSCASGEPEQ